MRTFSQLIQAALADPGFNEIRERPDLDADSFKVFQVNLTTVRYRGLQPVWFFAVLGESDSHSSYDSVQTSARALIRKASAVQPRAFPLVFLSDVTSVRLADMCRFDQHDVFGIDSPDLPSARTASTNPIRAPFIMAVRGKYSSTQLSTLLSQPYSPKHPVDGWRFFGRRNELEELVNSTGNFFVVGARMTGKTSLLKEAGRLLQHTQGAQVHFVPLQYVQGGQHEVVREILRTVAERESVTAVRRSKMLDEPLLKSVLQRMSRNSIPTVLILDELGNVLQKEQRRGDWEGLIGMLREFSHNGRLRVLMSGYQEFFIKQNDFEGPFVNLAKFVRLSGFTNPEIDEFLVQPLQFWGNISRTELLTLATTRVGRHPLLLQYFGKALFEKVARRANGADVNAAAAHLLNSEGIEIFHEPVDELFLRSGPATERFLFLKRCREAESSGEPLCDAELTDEWTKATLRSIGYASTFDSRRLILESLELRALTTAIGSNRSRQRIAAPIIYSYLRHAEPKIDALINTLGEDATIEHHRTALVRANDDDVRAV